MAAGLAAPGPELTLYEARVGGEVACVLGTADHGSDLGVYFVATDPNHQGVGLAGRLTRVALAAARDRGLRTASLQSSARGKPVYVALGFAEQFALHLYERRRGDCELFGRADRGRDRGPLRARALRGGRGDRSARRARPAEDPRRGARVAGGWFAESHETELRKALAIEDPSERATDLRTLLAEEARMGMMIGVAVGWALSQELNQ